jgi:hypothetical protein
MDEQSEEFTAGQSILVREYESDQWEERIFICYNNISWKYVCEHLIYGESQPSFWEYAKALSN